MLSPYLESSRDVKNVIEDREGFHEVRTVRIFTENWKDLFIAPTYVEFYEVRRR
jgi:hypothetical protein